MDHFAPIVAHLERAAEPLLPKRYIKISHVIGAPLMQPSPAGHPVYFARISGFQRNRFQRECKAAFHPCIWFTPSIPTSYSPLYCSPSFVPLAFERIPISGLRSETLICYLLQPDIIAGRLYHGGEGEPRCLPVETWLSRLPGEILNSSTIWHEAWFESCSHNAMIQLTSVWRWFETSCPHPVMASVVKMTVSW